MFFLPLILAAGSLPLISGAPVPSSLFKSVDAPTHSLSGCSSNLYASVFGGNGLVSDGWPSLAEWISDFETMFENNRGIMKSSCAQWNVPNNSDQEINHIKNSINTIAQSSSVDPRFILAIVMQESNGCVRAPTTNYGVTNPGLMQSHDGTGTCNDGSNVQNPCPESEILQMIKDGTAGTATGDGLQQCLSQEGGAGSVSAYYRAARCYNSGSVAPSGNLGQGIATHCYVSDIANRLLGWSVGSSNCNPGIVGSLTGSSWSDSSSSGNSPAPKPTSTSTSDPAPVTILPIAPAPTQTAAPSPAQPTTTNAAPAPAPTQSSPSPEFPIYPQAVPTCQLYDTVVSGDYCDKLDARFGISLAQLQAWNPGLDSVCSNLWKGYQYCVKA